METDNDLATIKSLHSDLSVIKECVYDRFGFDLTDLKIETESQEYGACSFRLNKMSIRFRVSKITPTKRGQFVTIWKRNENGVTQPFDLTDDIDFVIICSRSGNNFGQFIFPKSVLCDKRIIAGNKNGGKRGIRVYPPWDKVTSMQARKTQCWQIEYFLSIGDGSISDISLLKTLLL